MASNLDLSYAAGLIDGEGYVGIKHGGHSASDYEVVLSVNMCHERAVRWLCATFGGTVIGLRKRVGRCPVWRWTHSGRRAVDMLALLQPFLKVKSIQAWLAQEFWAQRTIQSPGYHVPPDELALRQGFKLALSCANQARG